MIYFPPPDILPALVEPAIDTDERIAADKANRERLSHLTTGAQATVRDYRTAVRLAGEMYQPAIARVVKRELEDWCDFGYRLGVNAHMGELHDQVMADARKAGLA
jgi:hypothetical protein